MKALLFDTLIPYSFVLLIGIFLVVYVQRGRKKRIWRVLEAVQSQRGGSIRPGGWLSLPQLNIELARGSIVIRFRLGSRHTPPATIVEAKLEQGDHGCNFFMYSEMTWFEEVKFLAVEVIKMGPLEFDNAFVVRTSSQSAVRTLLSSEIQQAMLEVDEPRGNLLLEDTTLRFSRVGYPDSGDNIIEMITVVEKVLKQLEVTLPFLSEK